jgi:hypothetical protein
MTSHAFLFNFPHTLRPSHAPHLITVTICIWWGVQIFKFCRFQWPRGLRRGSAAERLLGSWVRIPPGAWIFVSFECLCCQVEVSKTGRSLVQRSPPDCGVYLSVIKWKTKKPWKLLWVGRSGKDYKTSSALQIISIVLSLHLPYPQTPLSAPYSRTTPFYVTYLIWKANRQN